jgi:hypothetical protein
MTYKEMNKTQLVFEIERIQNLLITNTNVFTQKQNRKYLQKLYRRFEELNKDGNQ